MLNKYSFDGCPKSQISIRTVLIGLIILLNFMFGKNLSGQVAAYTNQPFVSNIPGWPTPTGGVNFRTPTVDWVQAKIAGSGVAPNDFEWVNAGTNPAAVNQDIAGLTGGAGFVRYINRTVALPSPSGAANGEAASITSRSLDWSGHTVYNAATDTIGISVFRDNTPAAAAMLDYIEVWVNTNPSLTGAVLALTTGGANKIYRSTTQAPVTGTPGWNRYQFVIPNDPRFWAVGTGGTSSAYVIVAGYSAGGNNIFLDNFNLPQWQTPMQVTGASVFVTQPADVGKGTFDNLMLGVQVTTRGSLVPNKIDGIAFSVGGSTNYLGDVSAAKCWYTGGGTSFATTLGSISVPQVAVAVPTYTNANLFFGTLNASGCPLGTTLPAFNFAPGNENFIWLAYDINAAAVSGHNVAADFEQLFTNWAFASCFGDTVVTSAGIQTPASFAAFTPSPSVTVLRQIDQAYSIPTYNVGTSWLGGSYSSNDYVSAVNFTGDNGTLIDNEFHDVNCVACVAVSGPYCNRHACHPPDYTQFKPQNLGQYYNRGPVQVTQGFGLRKGGAGYLLRSNCGTWPSSNTIGVFIDWNKDGDFDDRYGTGAGVNGYIYENYGSKTQSNTSMSLPVVWNANSSWIIDVPLPTDVVFDQNDPNEPNSPGSNNLGPIIVGNVRLRVREVYAAASSAPGVIGVHPFTQGYYGEVEDYTVQVLPDCPAIGANVCKWVGATNDWNDSKNWCPGVPTKNDIAYINTGPAVMPIILDNTIAECRTLQIMPGASLGINATKNSSLNVYDNVEIGSGATLGSASSVAVTSNFNASLTIPGRSGVPGTGVAFALTAPFRNQYQQKTQISYSATELANTFGMKAGDIVDQLGLEILAISPSAGLAIYPNIRIQAFLTTGAQVAYQFPVPVVAGTKMAVMAGDANVVAGWPKTIYNSAALNLNMTYAASGCNTGCVNSGNYTLLPLIPNTLIWDGVSNLVLSIEIWTQVGGLPGKIYIPGAESGPVFAVLALNYTSAVALANANFQSGWNLSGVQQYRNASTLVYTPLVNISANVTNSRPRLDFIMHRPYNQFPITVGGNWINNNRNIRTTAYSTTPVYGIPGDSGFIASNSRVIFNPAGRNTVNSLGLNSANAIYYPGIPGALLPADVDQDITSACTGGGNSTVFGLLEINKTSGANKAVRQASVYNPYLTGSYADTLALTNGELKLNRKEFILRKPVSGALIRPVNGGWLRSEDNGAPAGNIQSKFTWQIGGGTTGSYAIPFKGPSANVFNFKYIKNVGGNDLGNLTVATYGTPLSDNLPYPTSPQTVTQMTAQAIPTPGANAVNWTVDRFWHLKRSTNGGLAAGDNLILEYDNASEGTLTSAYTAGNMKAQYYGTTGWFAPVFGQLDAIAGGIISVTHPAETLNDTYTIWTIVNINNITQGPLPLSITNFSGKQIDKKVKLWWNVQSEANVANYSIERTVDHSSYEFIGSRTPVGPSNATLNYEVWDNKPLKGTQYYRLESKSTDGSTKYYGPVSVNFGTQGMFDITNVVADNTSTSIKVDFNYDSNLPYSYLVTDVLGNVVAKGDNNNALSGENSIVIPIQLSKGIYVISLINSDKTVSRKLVY